MLQKRFSQPNTLARYLIPSLPYSEFKEFIKTQRPVSFLIVRHPYDRLLSAYRDKFENKKKFYHLKYGRFMIRQYRKRGIRRFGKAFYRSSETSDYQVHPHWKAARRNKNDATPTFWEFVKSIIDYKILNEHWAPASSVCSICKVGYQRNVIIFTKLQYHAIIFYEYKKLYILATLRFHFENGEFK